jgi:peptidoglycan/LPS O-acetylase OafA/YrhL
VAATDQRRNNIGTLRLVGAIAVLFGHSFVLTRGPHMRDPISDVTHSLVPYHLGLPGLGVAMFFAISGYLVTRSFVTRGNLTAYTEARALRIFPALICAVAVTVVVGAFISTDGLAYLTSKQTLAYGVHDASLFDLRYTLPGVFADNPLASVNGSLWTLPVELRMYVLVAIAGVLGVLGRRRLFNAVAVAVVAVTVIWPDSSPLLAKPEHAQLAVFFLAGTALYLNRDRIPLRAGGLAVAFVLAALAAPTGAYPLFFAIAFAYAVLLIGLTQRVRLPDLAARGDLSYATYLYAFPVAQLWVHWLHPSSPWPVAALTLITVLPLAWLSWRLVEAPALRLKGRLAPFIKGIPPRIRAAWAD